MFRTSTNFDKLLDKATSNLRLDPDWPAILQISDLIRQNDCTPKYAVMGIKKKLFSQNPHQAMFALLVMESIVKNCGSVIHDEITLKANCDMFRDLVKSSQHENVRTKTLELIQAWAFAFRNSPKYRAVQDTVNIMKAEGYKFPTLKESDAMFSADSAPEWSDGDVCHRCRVPFSIMLRKHHCRACGQVFCQQCSAKTTTLPKFGIEKEVRVCDSCFDQGTRPPGPGTPAKADAADSPSDYTANSTQPAQPARKTAEELQEEEELQLALALSQSEAEQKEKEKDKHRSAPQSHTNPVPVQHNQTPDFALAGSPPGSAPPAELSRYLDRGYWEQRVQPTAGQLEPPSAPTPSPSQQISSGIPDTLASKIAAIKMENGASSDPEMEEFITALKLQVEIFVNRMKSNSSRGRSIANDSSVQTLFMNITTMHSRLLRYIQQQDDSRVHYEGLQDKLTQVKDSRAALDVLREEHADRLQRAAEQAERQRQLQMAHKLDIMRKKKQEYLQYQRQLALQRVQEQEREMQMRQEQQKHQYMLGGTGQYYLQGSPVHQYHNPQQPYQQPAPYGPGYPNMMPGMHQPGQMVSDGQGGIIRQPVPQGVQMQPQNMGQPMGHMPPLGMPQGPQQMNQQGQPMGQLPPGMGPPGAMMRQPAPGMGQIPQMGLPMNQGAQMNQQGPQLGMPGQQPMQQGPPPGQQMNQQMGPMQHGQQMPQAPQMNQQGQQMGQQMGQQRQPMVQQLGQQGQQMGQQGPPMLMQGPHLNQQGLPMGPQNPQVNQMGQPISQQMGPPRQHVPQMVQQPQQQHMAHAPPQLNNQMGPPSNQPLPPGHSVPQNMQQSIPNQIPGHIPGQQHMGQMTGNMNQGPPGQVVPLPVNPLPVADIPATGNHMGNLSPTSTAPGVPLPAPQNAQSSPKHQIPSVPVNSTAELISFD